MLAVQRRGGSVTRQEHEPPVNEPRRTGALLGTITGQVVAAFVFLALMFSTDRVAFVLPVFVLFVGASVAVWRRRATRPRQALRLAWACALGLLALLVVAGAVGLLGA
jgi:hypothetical protein